MSSHVSTAGVEGDLSWKLQQLERELTEARHQQAATSEILRVVSRSPTDLQHVFDAIITSAVELCGARQGAVFLYDGKFVHVGAHRNYAPEIVEILQRMYPRPPQQDQISGRAILTRAVAVIEDMRADPLYLPELTLAGAWRSQLAVPMFRDGLPIGAIVIARPEAGPFSASHIDLLKTFADQAVIAIENTRLFEAVQQKNQSIRKSNTQLTDALEQQTATSEILSVISRSPTDVQPVFDAIVESAVRLCDAAYGFVGRFDGELMHIGATHKYTPEALQKIQQVYPMRPDRSSVFGRVVLTQAVVHVPDVHVDPEWSRARDRGWRSMLGIPMMRDGNPIGVILVAREQPGGFSEVHIKLLETFAEQAVIAIENTRLFEEVQARTREVTEALEYQTATSDVLNVISRSPTDVQPVFDMIAESAARLCEAQYCFVYRFDGQLLHFVAHHGLTAEVLEINRRAYPAPPGRRSVAARAVLERSVVQIPDVNADPDYALSAMAAAGGYRSAIAVPILRDGLPIGSIALTRAQAGLLPDRQIELLKTFADQAVIAIENTRLFEEVQARTQEVTEALEYQTATSEVLNVISRSQSELQPVLDAIVNAATRSCQAEYAFLWKFEGSLFQLAAMNGIDADFATFAKANLPALDRTTSAGRCVLEKRTIHIPDVLADPEYQWHGDEGQRIGNYRSLLSVPLMRDDIPFGAFALLRRAVRPFTDKEIELVTTFADQAVIAIENTRLFEAEQARTKELQESLEYQTAMSAVLRVISTSPTGVAPVFDTILESAMRLCEAGAAALWLFDGETLRLAAQNNASDKGRRALAAIPPLRPGADNPTTQAALERRTIHAVDVFSDLSYKPLIAQGTPTDLPPAPTVLAVPLLREDELVGVITLWRFEKRAFSEKQIALVNTFAAQAVIAIENTRLFEEVQARTRELARSVEELKSLGEVSQTVNSTLELAKVLPAILEHACAMSYAAGGTIYVFDKASGEFQVAAGHNMSEEHTAMVRAQPMRLGSVVVGECAERREAVQIADLRTASPSPMLDILLRAGVRAVLAVPLMHQEEVIGALVVRRNNPGAFSPEIIRLLDAFAAQSAVAVHNARLFEEVEKKGRQLAVASQHKSQFVANMSHELRTPLAAILGYAELMQEGIYGALPDQSTPIVGRIRSNGTHLLGLINTVLDLSKIEAGQFSLSMCEYALDSMVENVRVATESLAQGKSLALKTDVAGDLPHGLGDEQRLTQVLLNLVGNAIKFTDVGEVRIAAAVRGGRFAVAVTDTGPGIPPEEQHKIFEEFHQVDNSNTKRKGGTGLGLAIAKQIVEMHGGRIWVESSVGKGSTFRMEVPVRAAAAEGAA